MSNCQCIPELEGLAPLAENPTVIVVAYLIVIFPWGIMQNVDFISEKWRTIAHTRHLGYLHLAFSLIPLPYIIFYAHLQRVSKDFKEMMAAVVVILMCIYHVMRTVWGLLQLDAYHVWCKDLAVRMLTLRMIHQWKWDRMVDTAEVGFLKNMVQQFGRMLRKDNRAAKKQETIDISGESVDNEFDGITRRLERILKVNNTVVDNELGGTDLSVSVKCNKIEFRRPSAWLATGNPGLCSARWSAAFLCGFGSYWVPARHNQGGRHDEYLKDLFSSCLRSLRSLKQVTFPLDRMRTQIQSDLSSTRGVYGTELGVFVVSRDLARRKSTMDNLASSYPSCGANDRLAFIELAEEFLNIKCTNKDTLAALVRYPRKFKISEASFGWSLLLWQCEELPSDQNSHVLDDPHPIPPFPWKHLLVPLWDECTNWRVLQATAHHDNRPSSNTHIPKYPCPRLSSASKFEHASRWTEQATYSDLVHVSGFTGCVMETVRTFLADWLHNRPSQTAFPNWSPSIPTQSIEFPYESKHNDIIWEIQCLLQEKIAKMDRRNENMAASPHLIMLFILAYPWIKASPLGPSQNKDIYAPFAPQKIGVRVEQVCNNGEVKLVMKLVPGDSVEAFIWADWIDTAMGFLKGLDDELGSTNLLKLPEHIVYWRTRTPSKCDLSRPLRTISKGPEFPELQGDIRVWTGWPFFDIKLVHFEMNQWMQAAGFIRGFGDVVRSTTIHPLHWKTSFKKEILRAEKGLLRIRME